MLSVLPVPIFREKQLASPLSEESEQSRCNMSPSGYRLVQVSEMGVRLRLFIVRPTRCFPFFTAIPL
jgi:hypothetical protein